MMPRESFAPRRQLSDEVASHLRQSIMAGEYSPGESIRAESLGATLDVSATPVREALHALRVEGFLELVPRRGFMVAPLVAADIRDIFEAHALIAGELAARAARNAEPEQLSGLEKIHQKLMQAAEAGDTELLERLNHQFHRDVYRMARSDRLLWGLSNFVKYVPRAFYAQIDGWPETTAADHSAILEALLVKDPEDSRQAMAQHIRNSGEKLAEHFESRQASASE